MTADDLPPAIVDEPAPVVSLRPSDAVEPIIEQVRRALAERAELPLASVGDESRLLGDLHLNSITVGQIVVELAARLGASIPIEPTFYATATVAEVAEALEELVRTGGAGQSPKPIAGVSPWFRAFVPALAEKPRPPHPARDQRPLAGRRDARR